MPEPVFYMRGYPDRESIPVEMVEYLGLIKDIPHEKLDEIASNLSKIDGFLSAQELSTHLKSFLSEDLPFDAIKYLVLKVKSEEVDDLILKLRAIQKDNQDEFPLKEEDIDALAKCLPHLIKPIPARRRFRKAKKLSTSTGKQVEEIQFICDLRPIFDETRERVEGLIPYTQLKLVVIDEYGLPNTFEVQLNAKQVINLSDQAQKAVEKLKVLRNKSEEWADFGLPNLSFIRQMNEE